MLQINEVDDRYINKNFKKKWLLNKKDVTINEI